MRPKLSYANVMATIAVFIALGGASYAALKMPKNGVGAKQLKMNAVTTAKVKNEAITAAKVKKGTLTGTQINLSTLGTVPNAQTADSSRTAQTANALAPPEPWHQVGTVGEPQFQNGCHDYGEEGGGGGIGPLRFYKDHEGVVHLEGGYYFCLTMEATGFQLPPGFRPDGLRQYPLAFGKEGQVVTIAPSRPEEPSMSGAVQCGKQICLLSGITFRAES
jgi:hypothetical protein